MNESTEQMKRGVGRPKGSINRMSAEIRNIIAKNLVEQLPQLFKDISEIRNAAVRAKALAPFVSKVLPDMRAVLIEESNSNLLSERLSELICKPEVIDAAMEDTNKTEKLE